MKPNVEPEMPKVHRLKKGKDLDLAAEELGPSARMMVVAPDAKGRLEFQFGTRPARTLFFPPAFARRKMVMIDEAVSTNFFDAATNAVLAIAGFSSTGTRIFFLGDHWGTWMDGDGGMHKADDIPELMKRVRLPVILQEFKQLVSVDFSINIYTREFYHPEVRGFFHEDRGLRYRLTLTFKYPTGKFESAKLAGTEVGTGKNIYLYEVEEFPLIWPKGARAPMPAGEKAQEKPEMKAEATPEAPQSADADKKDGPVNGKGAAQPEPESKKERWKPKPAEESPREKEAEKKPAPAGEQQEAPARERWKARAEKNARHDKTEIAESTGLPTPELLAMVAREKDADRKWLIIEPNLALGRAERTYALVSREADLISEKAGDWPPVRLKSTFGNLPGSIMIGIMHNWKVNQVLAVADANPESARILEWLREREIDRMLELKLACEITSVQQARRVLNVDTNADGATVKKTWRTLLGFLNADLGRVEERAIHRKKDEIAKELHVARDILMRKLK